LGGAQPGSLSWEGKSLSQTLPFVAFPSVDTPLKQYECHARRTLQADTTLQHLINRSVFSQYIAFCIKTSKHVLSGPLYATFVSLGPPESSTQTASRSLQPFLPG